MGKKVIFLFLFLISITIVNAVELEPEQIDKDLEIFQECNNCTFCNFTRVIYDGSNIFSNISATKDGTHFFFKIGGGNLTVRDTLTYCYVCGNEVESLTGCNTIPLTYTGRKPTIQLAILNIGFIAFLSFLFILILLSLSHLPTDVRDESGFVLEVSKLAYLRPIVKGGAWILITSIMFLSSNIAIAYLDTGMLGNFFFKMFELMMLSNLIIIPLSVIFMIQRITLSKEMLGLMERGVQFQ